MQGYLDDPALTAAAFSAGFLGTGDLARRRADGRVELVGRIKEIVSRGGNKIAPAEIENLFAGHPDVIGALCTGVPDERLGEALHVLLVPRPGSTLSADALRRWAAERSSATSSRTASISRTLAARPDRQGRSRRPGAPDRAGRRHRGRGLKPRARRLVRRPPRRPPRPRAGASGAGRR